MRILHFFGEKSNIWVFQDLISIAMGVAMGASKSAFGATPSAVDLNIQEYLKAIVKGIIHF